MELSNLIQSVSGGLLQLGFDGWGEDFNQFVEWRSADIYPIAWCELVRHPLQAPKENGHAHQTGPGSKKRSDNYQRYVNLLDTFRRRTELKKE